MTHRLKSFLRSLACLPNATLLLVLGACAHQPTSAPGPVLVQPIGNEQRIEDVVGALRAGDIKRSRKLLKVLAKQRPDDARVALLSQGLDGDPMQLLGPSSFPYRVAEGDQLTSLAQRYLGNRLQFYLLARYNGLTADNLQPGQLLRIPGTPPPPKPKSEPRPESRPQPKADPHRDARASPSAPSPRPAAPASAIDTAGASRLRAQALEALNRGAVAKAVVLLQRARGLNPANVPIRNDLARAERLLAVVRARQ